MPHFIITYCISLVSVQTNYCNNNLLILDVKQLNKIIKLYYIKTLWMAWVILRCVMGCAGLKSSYQEKGLFSIAQKSNLMLVNENENCLSCKIKIQSKKLDSKYSYLKLLSKCNYLHFYHHFCELKVQSCKLKRHLEMIA